MYIKYIKNNRYKNLFFIFFTIPCKNSMETFQQKTKKMSLFFELEFFLLIKQLSISTHPTKLTL